MIDEVARDFYLNLFISYLIILFEILYKNIKDGNIFIIILTMQIMNFFYETNIFE